MAKGEGVTVKPEMLKWARETAGLSIDAAAKKISIKPHLLAAWEAAERKPTVIQLRKAANAYKRPLAAFFLPKPPEVPALPHDFRRLPSDGEPTLSAALRVELRKARRRRLLALDLVDELGGEPPLVPISATIHDNPEELAGALREWLGVGLATQATWTERYAALRGWIGAFEAKGILVFQTSEVAISEMRGFSLSESVLPSIVLNGQDWPRARVFTLHHELAHLVLHEGGVCDPLKVLGGSSRNERVEVFCNRVAGAVLVPESALLRDDILTRTSTRTFSDADIHTLAERFAVSRLVILRRLLIFDRIAESYYRGKAEQYTREYEEFLRREREKQKAKPKDKRGGPRPSVMTIRENGRVFTRMVLEALDRDSITFADVSDYLGVQLKHLEEISQRVSSSSVTEE